LIYDDETKIPQRNDFHVVCVYNKKELKNLMQQLKIDAEDINVKYHPKKDESIITINDAEEKREEMALVVIKTENGNLSYILE